MSSTFSGDIKLTGVTWPSQGRQQQPGLGPMQLGQLVRARVEQVAPDGTLTLRLGDLTLHASAQIRLVPGQELLLKMISAGPQQGFSIVRVTPVPEAARPAVAGPGPEATNFNASQAQLLVSKQQPLSRLLQFLQLPSELMSLAPLLASSCGLLRKRCPVMQDLVQPQRLLKAIADSGLLLEARLAGLLRVEGPAALQGSIPPALTADLKMSLWQLLAAGFPAQAPRAKPAEERKLQETLWRLVEGVSAQISLRQMHAISQAEAGNFHWSIELPLLLDGQLRPLAISIFRENSGARDKPASEESWRVELGIELEPLGPLKVSLYVRDRRVSVALQAERQSAVASLRAELSQLEQSLLQQGFSVEALLSRPLANAPGSSGLPGYEQLLTVRA